MKKLLLLALPLLALPLVSVGAEDAVKKEVHRTTRLGTCSKEAHAKGLKGDERKKYISSCVASAKPAKASARSTG
jgi:hypothetical protein